MRFLTSIIVGATVLVAACGDSEQSREAEFDASLPGVYAGKFPCQNCPGIDVTLWLRPDRRFFIRQEYLADDDSPATTAYNLGRWGMFAEGQELELRGAGPRRSFERPNRDSLVLKTHSEVEHRLRRDRAAPRFTAAIGMSGMMRSQGNGALFSECYTGLQAPVQKSGDYARFQRQYRNAVRTGEPAFVEFEGRFVWSADGTLRAVRIENFRTVKDGQSC